MGATLKQVAERCGLSISTVSRVVTGRGYVSDEARASIEAAIAELGYVRRDHKPRYAESNSGKVLLIIGGIKSSIASRNVESMCQELVRHQKQPLVAITNFSADLEYEYLRTASDERYFGVIAYTIVETPKTIRLLRDYPCPIVMMGRYLPLRRLDCLRADYYKMGFDAAEYLISRGHTSIAFVGGSKNSTITQDRVTGFEDCMYSHGLEVPEGYLLHAPRLDLDDAEEIVEQLLALPDLPTAIVSANDVSAGIVSGLIARGIRIPEDVSVFACEDSYLAATCQVPLTAMDIDIERMSEDGAKALFRRRRHPDAPYTLTYYDPTIVVRDSVAAPRKGSLSLIRP